MMTNEIYTNELGSSGQTRSFLKTMDIEHPSNGHFLSNCETRSTTVKETAVEIAAPVKVECPQHDGEPTDHWRKRRCIPQELTESDLETGIRTSQKIAKLNKKSTKANYEFGGSVSSISSTRRKTHVLSKSSRLCRFRKTGIGRRNWPIAFARCTPSNAAVESFCEFSRKLPIDQAASGASVLATAVDGVMHRARLQALKALRDEQEQILFLKSADGLTKVLFSNTTEAQINTETSFQEMKIQALNKPPYKTSIQPSMTAPVQGVFKNPINDPILDSKVIQEDDQVTQVAPLEALESLFLPPVESRVIGKNGCRFEVDSSKDESCLFRSLPERPVLVPPSTTVLTGLAQPPPLARFRTSTESSNSGDFGSQTNDGDFSDDIVNRTEASCQSPVLVSIPYIDLSGGGVGHFSGLKKGTGCSYTSSFGGVQSCGSSGSFFVNSIPQSLKEAIQPHLPFVQDFQKPRLHSFSKSNSTSESAFASILDLIKSGEEALHSTLKKEENSEVFKEVICGKVINKVIVE